MQIVTLDLVIIHCACVFKTNLDHTMLFCFEMLRLLNFQGIFVSFCLIPDYFLVVDCSPALACEGQIASLWWELLAYCCLQPMLVCLICFGVTTVCVGGMVGWLGLLWPAELGRCLRVEQKRSWSRRRSRRNIRRRRWNRSRSRRDLQAHMPDFRSPGEG